MLNALALVALLFARHGGDLLPEGAAAPTIAARGADNRSWGQEFAGRITLVDFSATWCPHCRDALADEERLMAAFGARVQLVIVDVKEDPTTVRAFFARRRTPAGASLVLDVSGATARTWRVTAYPTMYLVDRRGVVRDSWSGWGDDTYRYLSDMIVFLEGEGADGARGGKHRRVRAKRAPASAQSSEDARARSLGVEILR